MKKQALLVLKLPAIAATVAGLTKAGSMLGVLNLDASTVAVGTAISHKGKDDNSSGRAAS